VSLGSGSYSCISSLRAAGPGAWPGFLALCWSSDPSTGPLDWQRSFAGLVERWKAALGTGDHVPANWELARPKQDSAGVLTAAGFEMIGRFEFAAEHRWTPPELSRPRYSGVT